VSGQVERFLSGAELAAVTARLGAEISADHPDGVTVIGVLNGSLCFLADLVRALRVPCEVDFLAVTSFATGAPRARLLKDLDLDLAGRDVVLVEHVVDTGLTTSFLVGLLRQRGPRSLRVCALLERPSRRIVPVELAYVGATAPEDFLVGYGFDLAGRLRNLDAIYALRSAPEQDELEALEAALFPGVAGHARAPKR